MKTEPIKQTFFQRSRNIILIFFSLAFLMISNALFEFHQSKQDLFQLMREQALSLIRSLAVASHNSLLANEYLEKLSDSRLFNNANLIKNLYENGQIDNEVLSRISKENDIFRIHIFRPDGKRVFSSHQANRPGVAETFPNRTVLSPIFKGATDTLVIGLRPARYLGGYRYAIALAGKNREAIVLSVDAGRILEFKRNIGFGALLRNVAAENPNIIYVALQDTLNILAASGNIRVLEAIAPSDYLSKSWNDSLFQTRTISFDSLDVYEATQLFTFRGTTVGLLRVGLSMKPIEEINTRIYRRMITLTLVLIIIGSFLLIFIFTRQRLTFLKKQYGIVETYSGNIINNVSDAIIVSDPNGGMRIFNRAAENLFEIKRKEITGQSFSDLFSRSDLNKINSSGDPFIELRCLIKKRMKHLFVSKSTFKDSDNEDNVIFVIRDLT
ncbi:MAG: PAS domain-containing sensor histidine kinase, partial [Calditrichales bacterium]